MSATLRRRVFLLAALLLTAWAVWDVSQPEMAGQKGADAPVAASKRVAHARPAQVASNFSGDLHFPDRREDTSPVRDLFEIPKPPEPKVIASDLPAPVAPPLPYVYLGRFEDGGKKQVFLAEGNNTLVVGAGAVFSGGWKLESIESGSLNFIYEPLGQKNSLQIREY